ncbi:MAG: DUF4956 domain-containing protein [Clostridia bacterium]|nr:DUF4956 domain-containing protein [Clostridia bacterium]
MFNLFATELGTTELTVKTYLIATAVAFACGILVALAACIKNRPSKSFLMSLILLPPIVETVILMVNGNVGTGIAVAGAFSLVRFRSVPGKAKEIAAIFLVMTAGLTCAAGYIYIALLFSLITAVAMLVLAFLPVRAEKECELRITVPETLNYTGVFEDAFKKYTTGARLFQIKTTSMGSLYRLTYRITLKDHRQTKEFLDELRCRNGNLEVAITETAEKTEEL